MQCEVTGAVEVTWWCHVRDALDWESQQVRDSDTTSHQSHTGWSTNYVTGWSLIEGQEGHPACQIRLPTPWMAPAFAGQTARRMYHGSHLDPWPMEIRRPGSGLHAAPGTTPNFLLSFAPVCASLLLTPLVAVGCVDISPLTSYIRDGSGTQFRYDEELMKTPSRHPARSRAQAWREDPAS